MNLDFSDFPGSIDEIEILRLNGGGFDINDLDTSSSGISTANPSGNVFQSNPGKILQDRNNISLDIAIYVDPAIWGNSTTYDVSNTITAINASGNPVSDTTTRGTEPMINGGIILGCLLYTSPSPRDRG